MKEITSPQTGAKIIINVADFEDSFALKSSISGCLASRGIDLSKINLDDLFSSDVSVIINPILALDSSPDVNRCIRKCMLKCTYNGESIKPLIFEPEKAREDYYLVVYEVLYANLSPFFSKVFSKFQLLFQKLQEKASDTPQ
jgi:hypothetical protein